MPNVIRVTVSYVVEVDVDKIHTRCEWSEDAAKERFLAKCSDTDEDDVPILDVTKLMFGPAPNIVYHDVISTIRDEIEDCDEEPEYEDEHCPKCDAVLSCDNFDEEDVHGDNEDGLCNDCIQEEEELANKKKKKQPSQPDSALKVIYRDTIDGPKKSMTITEFIKVQDEFEVEACEFDDGFMGYLRKKVNDLD